MARKTYKTKGAAKRARSKGRGIYKVKGGWRISASKATKKRRRRRRK